jgi:aminoglycoside phosphotransferase (APT) family kinase protein
MPAVDTTDLGFGWTLGNATDVVRAACSVNLSDVSHVVRLSDRSDRCVSLLITTHESYVLKTSPNTDVLTAEWKMLQLLSGAGISPSPIMYSNDLPAHLLLESFIPPDVVASSAESHTAIHSLTLNAIETSLEILYRQPVPESRRVLGVEFATVLRKKLSSWAIELTKADMDLEAERAKEYALRISTLYMLKSTTFLHGDLRPENFIIRQGACFLIDFEHAGVGDPLFDLSKLLNSSPKNGIEIARRVAARLPYTKEFPDFLIEDRLSLYSEVHKLGVLTWETRGLQSNQNLKNPNLKGYNPNW